MKGEGMAEASGAASNRASRSPTEAWRVVWRVVRGRFLRWRQRSPRRLKLCETLALGERRFVAVVEFERTRFLVGGTAASLVLLARLDGSPDGCQEAEKEEAGKEEAGKEVGGSPCRASRAAW